MFNGNADPDARGVASYDIDRGLKATKKRAPSFSQSKGAQFELWAKETKKAKAIPGPDNYKQDDMATKQSRFNNIHLGTDKKVTAKDIKLTPGPGHYSRTDEQFPKTFHHATKHGS